MSERSQLHPKPDLRSVGDLGLAPVLLVVVTALGFWLRWLYARDVSLFVDEYLTIRAADKILERGIPLLPSGNFYSHGLVLSYVEALVRGLGGRETWLMRLPVVLLSTAAIPLLYWIGRRMFSPAAGLVAAALLAVAPEAILWGGRVRMYAPLQFFVLLATTAFWLWVVEKRDHPRDRMLFLLAFWGALFCHAEAMLLLPFWGLWALVQRGWRWLFRPANLAPFALAALAVVAEILLRRIGPAVQAWVAPGILEPLARQYVSAGLFALGSPEEWAALKKVVQPLFLTPPRLPFTLLAVGGSIAGIVIGLRGRRQEKAPGQNALLYLAALLLWSLSFLLFGVDPEWKSPRYGLMILPHVFLLAGAALAGAGRWLEKRVGTRRGWAAQIVTVGLLVAAFWPSAVAATKESVPSYEWAFGYVQAHQEPEDVVITFLCPAAFLTLGRCDYLAIPADFSGFAVQRDGRWVSGWDHVPMIDSASSLREALAQAPRAWFVVDEGRLGRYEAGLLKAMEEEMELVAAEHEVLVFRSRPPKDVLQTGFTGRTG